MPATSRHVRPPDWALLLALGAGCAAPPAPAVPTSSLRASLDVVEKGPVTDPEIAAGDVYGGAAAMDGDTLVVGAPADAAGGAVYVFTRAAGAWTRRQKLTTGLAGGLFGQALAIQGDSVFVGAPAQGKNQGAVYVFTRAGDTWTERQRLTAADAAEGDIFGTGIALDRNTMLVGAPGKDMRRGAAYVLTRAGDTWGPQQKLVASDAASFSAFGQGLALEGDEALVGSPDRETFKGKVYQFLRSGTTWTEKQQITAPGAAIDDSFGYAIAMRGGQAFLSRPGKDNQAGTVHRYERTGDTWTERQAFTSVDNEDDSLFGNTMAFDGEVAVVGAPQTGLQVGAAYLILKSGGTWTAQQLPTPMEAMNRGQFGDSVALSGTRLVIGASNVDDQGTAFAFALPREQGRPCATSEDCVSGFCADGVCCDSACGGSDPGDCQACSRAAGASADGTCGLRQAGATCRAAAGVCDVAEQCTGQGAECPPDALAPATQVCRQSTGPSDPAELCSGTSVTCGPDEMPPAEPPAEPPPEPGTGRISGGGLSCAFAGRPGDGAPALLAAAALLGLLRRRRA